jgi:hypothetical protein
MTVQLKTTFTSFVIALREISIDAQAVRSVLTATGCNWNGPKTNLFRDAWVKLSALGV